MRHGQTLFNKSHRIQGACDSPLTDKGIKDVIGVKNYFIFNKIVFDYAYSSTQERACDSLEHITSQPYQRIKGLKEWNFGVFEGQSEQLNPPDDPIKKSYGDFFLDFQGESDSQVQDRMVKTLTEIMDKPEHNKVLVVSHGGACFMFLRRWLSISSIHKQVPSFHNCCILKFNYENKIFTFIESININN